VVPNQVAVSDMGITACQSPTASANTGEAKIREARRGRPAVLHVTDDEHAGAHAQHMRESLTEPAFHPAGGDQHELLCERIGARRGEQPAEAFELGQVPAFGLVVADEAHRCAGPISSAFGTILDAKKIKARRRLFMTATPRYFTGRVLKEAKKDAFEVASMNVKATHVTTRIQKILKQFSPVPTHCPNRVTE